MPSVVCSSNTLHNAPVARRLSHLSCAVLTMKSLLSTGESSDSLIRTACLHINPCYHCPVTPLASPREREECEAIQIKGQDSQHTPVIWRQRTQEKSPHPSSLDERRPERDIPFRESHRSVDKGLGVCNLTSSVSQTWLQGFLNLT